MWTKVTEKLHFISYIIIIIIIIIIVNIGNNSNRMNGSSCTGIVVCSMKIIIKVVASFWLFRSLDMKPETGCLYQYNFFVNKLYLLDSQTCKNT